VSRYFSRRAPALGTIFQPRPAKDSFYATPGLTPTDKAVIVASLMSLGNGGDREVFIARTAQAKTYPEGFAYRRKAELTAAFAKRVSPVRSFFNVNGTPVMQTGAGGVAIVPVDYVYWSPGLAQLVYASTVPGDTPMAASFSRPSCSSSAARSCRATPRALCLSCRRR
jgi:hypothetical protein